MKVTFTAGAIPAQIRMVVHLFEEDSSEEFGSIMDEVNEGIDPPITFVDSKRHLKRLIKAEGVQEAVLSALESWLGEEHVVQVSEWHVDSNEELKEYLLKELGDMTGVNPEAAGWDASDIQVVHIDYDDCDCEIPLFLETKWSEELPDSFQALLSACEEHPVDAIQAFSANQHHYWRDMEELVDAFTEAYIGVVSAEGYYRSIHEVPDWISCWVDWEGMAAADSDLWAHGRHLFLNR